jgi:hypothetical protein
LVDVAARGCAIHRPSSILRGVPAYIRFDNAPSSSPRPCGSGSLPSAPGLPTSRQAALWANGYIESFNARLRDELLRHYGASAPRLLKALRLNSVSGQHLRMFAPDQPCSRRVTNANQDQA